ncbi:MAG TPA: endonuclease III [Anaerolineae bacterium]|nr:endonuclease III [Anaerolineae bacterium]HQH38929.1 endonuclease III [Anaerolineae bacterium]
MTTSSSSAREAILEIHRQLCEVYGDHPWQPEGDPLAALVNTILSQNTNDRNRDSAYIRLREQFPTWEAVRDAPPEAVIAAIRPAGLAPSKGPRIQDALRQITAERGELSLDFLQALPLEEARQWLMHLNGVGPKTAAIVLLFALGRAAFPVDTHIHRVTRRLGLIPATTSREKAHTLLEALVPPELYGSFHLNVIAHGRQICHARHPECDVCPLQSYCAYYHNSQQGGS